jgi:hypothetical protein
MTLPRLHAELPDDRAIARVLRGALRHEVEVVPLASAPASAGQHLLEVSFPGSPSSVVLLADPIGNVTDRGQPLHVRPVTRDQMASLLTLVERLDERPSTTAPPPGPVPAACSMAPGSDVTLMDSLPMFGVIESLVPPLYVSVAAPRVANTLLPEESLVDRVVARK